MTEDDLDRNRRHFLTVATVVTGAVCAGLAAIPFLASLKPSARAQALGAGHAGLTHAAGHYRRMGGLAAAAGQDAL